MTSSTGRTLSLPGFALALGALLGAQATSGAQTPPLPPPGQAQQAIQQAILQNPELADSLRRRLLASGLTPEQIRARLQASGYPSNLLDAYLGPAGPGSTAAPSAAELGAIQALGLPAIVPLPHTLAVNTGIIRLRHAT